MNCPPLNGTTSREIIWWCQNQRSAFNATRKERTGRVDHSQSARGSSVTRISGRASQKPLSNCPTRRSYVGGTQGCWWWFESPHDVQEDRGTSGLQAMAQAVPEPTGLMRNGLGGEAPCPRVCSMAGTLSSDRSSPLLAGSQSSLRGRRKCRQKIRRRIRRSDSAKCDAAGSRKELQRIARWNRNRSIVESYHGFTEQNRSSVQKDSRPGRTRTYDQGIMSPLL